MIDKTKEFVEKAIKIHGEKYDYFKVEYKNATEKVEIVCKNHGSFFQSPSRHLMGRGCLKCWHENKKDKDGLLYLKNGESFIEKAIVIHGNLYDYSLVEYKGCQIPVEIICPEHGIFKINPSSHLSGKGCQKCGELLRIKKKTLTQDRAISNMIKIHRNKYDYSLVEYINGYNKIKIICPTHGVFEQTYNDHFSGIGCPYCSNKKIHELNCIGYKRLDLLKYFVDIEDSKKYTEFSSRIINVKCPDCGDTRTIRISDMSTYGFSCHKCNDNISLPEKFCYNLLKELDVDFTKEKVFNWSENKRYDFYIPSLDMIIEVHGEQHYTQSFKSLGGKSVEEEKINDNYKENLAKLNGIKSYLVVDCRNSDLNWLEYNFIKSLGLYFNLENVDWKKMYLNSNKSIIVYICEQWNKYYKTHTTKDLAELLKLNQSMIANSVKRGVSLGLCEYDKELEKAKSARKISKLVVQLDLDGNFVRELKSCREGLIYGFNNSNISACCKGKRKKHKGFKFVYKENYIGAGLNDNIN